MSEQQTDSNPEEEFLGGETPEDTSGIDELLRNIAEESLSEGENWPNAAAAGGKTAELEAELAESEAKSADLEAKSIDLAAQLADTRDQLLRKAAEFENSRKRMNAEKQNAIEFANQNLIMDIIPMLDDFERAIQSAESSEELTALPAGKTLLEGIVMIEKRMVSRLEGKWGLKRFDSAGQPFDPVFHEAVLMDKSPDVGEPVVQEEYIKGYTLKDRVIRAAQVKVLMPEEERD
jgi:molecular chaperone GrpE